MAPLAPGSQVESKARGPDKYFKGTITKAIGHNVWEIEVCKDGVVTGIKTAKSKQLKAIKVGTESEKNESTKSNARGQKQPPIRRGQKQGPKHQHHYAGAQKQNATAPPELLPPQPPQEPPQQQAQLQQQISQQPHHKDEEPPTIQQPATTTTQRSAQQEVVRRDGDVNARVPAAPSTTQTPDPKIRRSRRQQYHHGKRNWSATKTQLVTTPSQQQPKHKKPRDDDSRVDYVVLGEDSGTAAEDHDVVLVHDLEANNNNDEPQDIIN